MHMLMLQRNKVLYVPKLADNLVSKASEAERQFVSTTLVVNSRISLCSKTGKPLLPEIFDMKSQEHASVAQSENKEKLRHC